jgi:hypothetical protein
MMDQLNENIPSFQLHFGDSELLEDINPEYSAIYFMKDEWFGKNQRVWEEYRLRKTFFYKIKMTGREFLGIQFPELFGKRVFLGEFDFSNSENGRILVIESDFFQLKDSFYSGMFYVQVSDEYVQNGYSNSKFFIENVFENWKEKKSFRAKIIDENREELEKLKKEKEALQKKLEEIEEKKSQVAEVEKRSIKKETPKANKDSINEHGIFIWDGFDLKDFGVKPQKALKQLKQHLENENIEAEIPHILSSYLGKQQIEMIYDYVSSEFRVSYINNVFSGDFKVEVPENRVDDFEKNVKSFNFHFQKKYQKVRVGYKKVKTGTKKVPHGYKIIKNGTKKVPNGTELIKKGTKKVPDGFEKVVVGQKKILVGSSTFDNKPKYKTVDVLEKKQKYKIVDILEEVPKYKIVDVFAKKQEYKIVDVIENKPIYKKIERLLISDISAKVREDEFFAKDFDPLAFIKAEEKRERELEIVSNTVVIGSLMVLNDVSTDKLVWKDACEYCEKLKTLNFEDWRIPTKNEFRKIGANQKRISAIKDEWYWSGTTYNEKNSWIYNYQTSSVGWNLLNREGSVLCVRDLK